MTARGWCFTWFLPAQSLDEAPAELAQPELPRVLPDKAKFLCYQMEETKEGKRHIQGYVEWQAPVRRAGCSARLAQSGFAKAHLEARKGTPEQARAYCSKSESAVPDSYFEAGELPTGQGSRSDLKAVETALKKGSTVAEIASTCTTAYIKYFRGIERARAVMTTVPSWRQLRVKLLIGPPGCGKTRSAHEDEKGNIYAMAGFSPEWWDGYDGHKAVLLDDFYGEIKYERLLRVLDGYPLKLPIKGGYVDAMYERVYITSNVGIADWYKGRAEVDALARRIHETQVYV